MPTCLDGAANMKIALCHKIGFVSEVGGFVIPKPVLLAAMMNRRAKLFVARAVAHTKKASRIVSGWEFLVLGVKRVIGLSQVAPPVVVANAVDMVNKFFWHLAGHIQPSKAMGRKRRITEKPNYDVAISVKGTSYVANRNSAWPIHFLPSKKPGIAVVAKTVFQKLLGNYIIGIAHLSLLNSDGPGSDAKGRKPLGIAHYSRGLSFQQ